MARLSFLEHHTLQPGGQGQAKPLCLRNPDYAKMRKRIELSFPDQPETTKVKKQKQTLPMPNVTPTNPNARAAWKAVLCPASARREWERGGRLTREEGGISSGPTRWTLC